MPAGRNSSGFRPAEASRPIAPEICESTIQKSPCGVDSTRGARSRSFAGADRVHRSLGGFTCESAEMSRSFGIPFLLAVLNRAGRAESSAGPPARGGEARTQRVVRRRGAGSGTRELPREVGVDLVLLG